MRYKYKNLIYFQNGSIGDFLMIIFFLENIHLNDDSIILNVVVPKNEKLLLQFLEKYLYINIILANKRSFKGVWGILKLTKFVFAKNLIITAPTPGKLSLFVKIIAKKISLLGRSELMGFDDDQKINKFIYTKLLKYNTKIIYPDFLKTVIRELGFEVKKETPSFDYSKNDDLLGNLSLIVGAYIVINPMASTQGRSLDKTELSFIIETIKNFKQNLKIVLVGSKKGKDFISFFDGVLVCADLPIFDLCSLIEDCNLFIGVDTGITHLVSFLQKKSLVIAHPITASNWLPFYNLNATILYTIKNCQHNIHCGREYLEKYCKGILMCFEHTALDIVENKLKDLL